MHLSRSSNIIGEIIFLRRVLCFWSFVPVSTMDLYTLKVHHVIIPSKVISVLHACKIYLPYMNSIYVGLTNCLCEMNISYMHVIL